MSARALLQRFDIVADQTSNIPALRRLVVDLAVRGKLLPIKSFDMTAQEMLRRISSKVDELALAGAIKKLIPSSKIGDEEVPAAYLAHCTFARLGNIANLQKGLTGIQSSLQGQFPLVATGAERGTCDHFDFDGAAAIIPLVSSTGHGNASINRLHYQDGKFALGTILCAVFPFDEQLVSARFLFEYLTAFKEELLVSKMIGTANVTLTLGKLADVPVPIVPPTVQKRVDELMALCDQLEAAQQERERRRDRLAAASLQRLNQPAADTTPEAQREHARFHLHHLPRLTTRPVHIKAMREMLSNLAIRGRLVKQDVNGEPANKLLHLNALWRSAAIKRKQIREPRKALAPTAECDPPFRLPTSWAWARLGEVVYVQSGDGLTAAKMKAGSVPVFGGNGINGYHDSFNVDASTLVIGRVGYYCGSIHITPDKAWITDNAFVTRYCPDLFSLRFLALLLATTNLKENEGATAQPVISGSKIYPLIVGIPPLAEQHRIVAKVDELMALCDQLEAQLTTTQTDSRRLLEAVLDAALVK